jgi:hypothetical protein
MTGQAEGQPVEGVATLSDLAAEMDTTEASTESEDGDQEETDEADAESEQDEGQEGQDEAEDEAQEEPTVTIKHDGKEVTLKQSEVVELAQQGFDYTKKTMAVAEERKAVEAEREHIQQSRQQIEAVSQETLNRLQAYTQFMEAQIGTPPPISLAQQDAASYLAQKEIYESRRGQLNQAYSEIQNIQNETARQRQAVINERAEAAEKVLKDTLPGWGDTMLSELSSYADKAGLNPRVASEAMLTPGFWEVVHKAKAYDAIQADKAKLKPKSELPKVHKPLATNQPSRATLKRADAEKQYAAKPSLNTLSALIE